MSTLALVLFAKNPYLSPVKTRLEKQTSKSFAIDFYQQSLETTIDLLESLRLESCKSSLYIAVAEENELNHNYWNGDYNKIAQGIGGLGQRLNKVYKELISEYDAVFFFGADSPFINKDVLTSSIQNFITSDTMFMTGPSTDGGFYVFGGKVFLEESIWNNVEYSTNQTYKQLKALINDTSTHMEIEQHFDIDEKDDFSNLSQLNQDELTLKQQDLLSWLKK